MPRPQFTLRALLVAMLAICCFLGGMATGVPLGYETEQARLRHWQERIDRDRDELAEEWNKLQQEREKEEWRNLMRKRATEEIDHYPLPVP